MSHKVSLIDLEPEVLSAVLEYVDDASPFTTKAVACVNRYLNQLTRLVAHRHTTIEINGLDQDGFLSVIDLLSKDQIPANIRTLTVKGRIGPAPQLEQMNRRDTTAMDDEAAWAPLVTLISRIGKLRRFDWTVRYPLPVIVFKALEQHQRQSTLRIFNFARRFVNTQQPEPIELLLAESTALTHIRYVTQDQWVLPDIQEVAFRSIVGRAPNLQYAGLIHLRPTDEDDEDGHMETIKSRFYTHDKPNSSIRQLTLDGVEISRRSLIDWSSTVDLTTLEMVKFTKGFPSLDYFQAASGMLPNLKHFSLNLRLLKGQPPSLPARKAVVTAFQNFITSCSPLETLSLWSWMDLVPLPDLLRRHGPTLQTLQLHERETPYSRSPDVLKVDDIRSIRSSCPNLRDFTFDLLRSNAKLRRENDSNEEYYAELAQFQHLDTLQIYFDLGACYVHWKATQRNAFEELFSNPNFGEESDDSDEEAEPSNDTNSDGAGQIGVQAVAAMQPSSSVSASQRNDHASAASPYVRPSRDIAWEPYAKAMWKKVFGHKKCGARELNIKVGDWEGVHNSMTTPYKRHFVITPNERDDVSEPAIKVKKGGKSHLSEPR